MQGNNYRMDITVSESGKKGATPLAEDGNADLAVQLIGAEAGKSEFLSLVRACSRRAKRV